LVKVEVAELAKYFAYKHYQLIIKKTAKICIVLIILSFLFLKLPYRIAYSP
jgi:hypothetical protein